MSKQLDLRRLQAVVRLVMIGVIILPSTLAAQGIATGIPVGAIQVTVPVARTSGDDLHDIQKLEARVKRAVEKCVTATVAVEVRGRRGGLAFGSGVIVSEDGYVLTAAHVSSQPNRKVKFRLSDGRIARGITLGLNQDLDMGLMKITDVGPWPFLRRTRSGKVATGDWCIGLGHPGGFEDGSSQTPLVRIGRVLKTTRKVLLTDCALVGGDSGGPLVDLNGSVIAIHSRIGADLTTNLHVPVDRYAEAWDRLAKGDVWGEINSVSPWIGVHQDENTDLALIKSVHTDSPAERAGLEAGDLIVRLDEDAIESFGALKQKVAKFNPGDVVSIQVRRDDVTIETPITIGSKKDGQNSQTRDDAELLRDWLNEIERSRRLGQPVFRYGKNAGSIKNAFMGAMHNVSRGTVNVMSGRYRRNQKTVALGTVVDSSGLILTKASQLQGKADLYVRPRGAGPMKVQKVAESRTYDLALLALVDSDQTLSAIDLRNSATPMRGTLLATSSIRQPVAVGVASGAPVEIPSEGKLGVVLDKRRPGSARVRQIVADSGADMAGVKQGDVVKAIDDQQITTAQELVDIVGKRYPGDHLRLLIDRNGGLVELEVELGRYSEFDEALAEFEDFVGGQLSPRRTGFTRVVQHDTALLPRHCGGPVVDAHGRFVGINIARAARTTSYLLPADEVKLALRELKAISLNRLETVEVDATSAIAPVAGQ